MTAHGPLSLALHEFRASGSSWLALPFFSGGAADAVCARVDRRIAEGATVLPSPDAVFRALTLTPLETVKAVILGQDPYPTPGDANGLAFSYVGPRRLPASLKVILAELPGAAGERRSHALGETGRAAPELGPHRGGRQVRRAPALWLVRPHR